MSALIDQGDARADSAWNAALEEAAKWHDMQAEFARFASVASYEKCQNQRLIESQDHYRYAASIRALKTVTTQVCPRCDGTGYVDHAGFRMDPCECMTDKKATPAVDDARIDAFDAGLLNDFGGGNVDWWQDYIRSLLNQAHDHYIAAFKAQEPQQ